MATITTIPGAPAHKRTILDPTKAFALGGRNGSSDSSRTSDTSSEKVKVKGQRLRKFPAQKGYGGDYVVDRSVSPNRLKTFLKAFKHIRDLSPQQVDDFMASYEIYNLEWADEDAMVAAFGPEYPQRVGQCLTAYYSVINHLCSLGDVEKMYIPPLMNKKASVRDNQLLCEESIAREIGLRPGMRVLDLGCGRGRVAAHMASFSGARITGINRLLTLDIKVDANQVAQAREFNKQLNFDNEFIVHDQNDLPLPFADESFDAFYEIQALSLCKDPTALFKEIYRVLKPGSKFLLIDWVSLPAYDPATKVRSYAGSAYGAPASQRPNLLELSGIGDKELLNRHEIPVRVDLPGVGENLQDHLMTGLSYEVVDGVITGDPLMRQEPEALALAQKLYVENKAGPFTIGGMQSHAFMLTPDATALLDKLPREQKPTDSEYYDTVRSIIEALGGSSGAWLMFLAQTNLHEGGKSFVGTQLLPENFVSLGCVQSHPFSRGSTHISSTDINAVPDINPAYFSHPADLEIMARHLQALDTKLRPSEHLSRFLKPDGKRNHPDAFHVGDLDGAKKYVLDTATSAYHSCGSAAMLPRERGGVVDPKLVVYGTENLRIVDASIFPLIPRGNILSSVYAVAEKAANIIKGH
ncbi:hypothetical protein NUW58_g7558 [Xylaria curta]|uniref:Uncharacterized protein n=1 Tax=Xylaria curta TaxID=42375 RepID=A0ACC1NI87_9PEZI|nr:hypothetical protein NUW58_g7558 [Xylaria curta]